MLVNTHKLIFISLLFMGWNILQAQEVWTLKQCIDTAQIHNKNLQINRNNISISEQKKMEAKANLIPKITTPGTATGAVPRTSYLSYPCLAAPICSSSAQAGRRPDERRTDSVPFISRMGERAVALDLDDLKDVKRAFGIRVAVRGRRTDASPEEARSLVVGALNTLHRASGARVRTLNAQIDGKPVAVAFIENAKFDEDSTGSTTLEEPE